MDNLQQLDGMSLSLPSPSYIFGLILFGVLGYAAYRYGKRTANPLSKWLGIALMLYPYAVSETWLLYAVGTALTTAVVVFRNYSGLDR